MTQTMHPTNRAKLDS